MKKRSRLRRRVREWLRKRKERKEQKEEKPLPSFGSRLIKGDQEQFEQPKNFYQSEKPTEE